MKIKSRTTLRNKADKLWSELIRVRDNHQCRYCGSTKYVNPHHIIGRSNLHLRFEPCNGILLCSLHHTFGNESAHKNPVWFMDFLDAEIPDILQFLRKEMSTLEPHFQYEECIEKLQSILTNLKN